MTLKVEVTCEELDLIVKALRYYAANLVPYFQKLEIERYSNLAKKLQSNDQYT